MYKLYIEKNITSHELLNKVLHLHGINKYTLVYNEFGKPYLENNLLFFNISHDKDITVLVISDKEIGIDLEYLTYRKSVICKYFNEKEQQIMKKSNNLEYDFTKIWVMKESFVKKKGIGLQFGLKNVDTTKITNQIDLIDKGNYLIAICK